MLSIVRLYNEEGVASPSFISEADELGLNPDTLGRHCRNFNQYEKIFSTIPALPQRKSTFEKAPLLKNRDGKRISDITHIDPDTDQSLWLQWLNYRLHDDPVLSIMHPCDVHAPFWDTQALDLYFELAKRTQPDLTIVGSDFWDFYMMSTFAHDPAVSDGVELEDELDALKKYWRAFTFRMKQAAPDTKMVFIWGNHERRILRRMLDRYGALAKTIMKWFINIIRAEGAVWYVGEVDHVRVGQLQIEHGNRHNMHVAKSRLEDEGSQINLWMGHVHKENFYVVRGADFTVRAVSSGCLCNLTPHYLERGRSALSGRKWTQGTAIGMTDLQEQPVQMDLAGVLAQNPRDPPESSEQLCNTLEQANVTSTTRLVPV